MRTHRVVVLDVLTKHPPEMLFVDRDDMVETLAPERADDALGDGVGIRRVVGRQNVTRPTGTRDGGRPGRVGFALGQVASVLSELRARMTRSETPSLLPCLRRRHLWRSLMLARGSSTGVVG